MNDPDKDLNRMAMFLAFLLSLVLFVDICARNEVKNLSKEEIGVCREHN